MTISDDTVRRLAALNLGDKLQEVIEILADALGARNGKRGVRLAPTWKPTDDDWIYACEHGFSKTEIEGIAENFRDYWCSKPGREAMKLDWAATWRTWIRNQRERRPMARERGHANGSLFDLHNEIGR